MTRATATGAAWPIGIAATLAVFVLANLAVMRIADQPAALAHDRDYYRRAVNFDAERAVEARSARLGWRVALDAPPADAAGTLRATIADAAGRPLDGAVVRVSAFHLAHADDVRAAPASASAAANAAGAYEAPLALDRPGRWEVTVDVRHAREHLVVTRRLEVRAGT